MNKLHLRTTFRTNFSVAIRASRIEVSTTLINGKPILIIVSFIYHFHFRSAFRTSSRHILHHSSQISLLNGSVMKAELETSFRRSISSSKSIGRLIVTHFLVIPICLHRNRKVLRQDKRNAYLLRYTYPTYATT